MRPRVLFRQKSKSYYLYLPASRSVKLLLVIFLQLSRSRSCVACIEIRIISRKTKMSGKDIRNEDERRGDRQQLSLLVEARNEKICALRSEESFPHLVDTRPHYVWTDAPTRPEKLALYRARDTDLMTHIREMTRYRV